MQAPILDGFAQVHGGNVFLLLKVRDGAGDFEDSGVAADRQAQVLDGLFEKDARAYSLNGPRLLKTAFQSNK